MTAEIRRWDRATPSKKRLSSPGIFIAVPGFFVASDTTEIWADEINLTQYTEHKLGPKIYAKPVNFNYTQQNRAVFRALPVGFAGFGGSFDASDLSVFRTTTGGLAAGSTFSTDQQVWISGSVIAADNVTMIPVHESVLIGGGAASASVISIPDGITSMISIAATWTSTTSTTIAGGGTTSAITHTAGDA